MEEKSNISSYLLLISTLSTYLLDNTNRKKQNFGYRAVRFFVKQLLPFHTLLTSEWYTTTLILCSALSLALLVLCFAVKLLLWLLRDFSLWCQFSSPVAVGSFLVLVQSCLLTIWLPCISCSLLVSCLCIFIFTLIVFVFVLLGCSS